MFSKQGSTPTLTGPAKLNPKKGAPETENPLFIGFTALRGGSGPWSQTMVSEGARPWGRDLSEFADMYCLRRNYCLVNSPGGLLGNFIVRLTKKKEFPREPDL